ncbi:MAG: Mur ligase domain-containing protein, partial [Nitrospirota bacterium]
MKLREVLQGCDYINLPTPSFTKGGQRINDLSLDVDITGVAYDSREVKEGYLFVAITGERYDGHDFIKDAIKKGAIAIVYEKAISPQSLVNSQQSNPPLPPNNPPT